MENEILKKKTVINGILYTPTVVPDVLKDCLLILAHDKQGYQWIEKDPQFTQTVIPLERHEKDYPETLYPMQHMHKTQYKITANPKGTLQGATTTNGIHCHGL